MKPFSTIITEATVEIESEFTVENTEKIIKDSFAKYFPHSSVSHSKNSIASDKYMIFVFTLGKEKGEFSNGINMNDPLNLMLTIDISSTPATIKYERSSVSIKPSNPHMAFGSSKLKLRKTKVKNEKDLKTKMDKAFSMVQTEIKSIIKNGDFEIYSDHLQNVFKKKLGM